jgi:isopentenyl phosphate kinase
LNLEMPAHIFGPTALAEFFAHKQVGTSIQ